MTAKALRLSGKASDFTCMRRTCESQKVVQHVEVVLEEGFLQARQFADGRPRYLRRVVVRPHRREGRGAQVEVVGVRDGAAALAAVRVVEHGHALQRGAQGGLGQVAVGFFRQLVL